jgi:hypothetical protein
MASTELLNMHFNRQKRLDMIHFHLQLCSIHANILPLNKLETIHDFINTGRASLRPDHHIEK